MYTCELPSGMEISVSPPSYQDRIESVKEYRQVKDEVGYSVEELMAAKAINAIDGNVVTTNLMMDPIMLISEWPNSDVQFYIEWFMTLFFLEDKVRDKATKAAKKIMMNQQTVTTTSKK